MDQVKNNVKENIGSGKNVLHFSDGIMEITETENEDIPVNSTSVCDTKNLDWGPWTLHMTKFAGTKALEVCDYLGESLASFFGITTPKYQFEINEYHRIIKEREEEAKKDLELGTWVESQQSVTGKTVTQPPQSERY